MELSELLTELEVNLAQRWEASYRRLEERLDHFADRLSRLEKSVDALGSRVQELGQRTENAKSQLVNLSSELKALDLEVREQFGKAWIDQRLLEFVARRELRLEGRPQVPDYRSFGGGLLGEMRDAPKYSD